MDFNVKKYLFTYVYLNFPMKKTRPHENIGRARFLTFIEGSIHNVKTILIY